ncbi:MAG: hypothetical protein DRH26_01810 [Deltaproteobacteria bacterium]|nr:MAG: hypothetical protein DRH26_01810 [Deltaproteobacteria bacterium]
MYLLDNSHFYRQLFVKFFNQRQIKVLDYQHTEELEKAISCSSPDVLVIDYLLPAEANGCYYLLDKFKNIIPAIIVVSGDKLNDAEIMDLYKSGATDVKSKDLHLIFHSIKVCLERKDHTKKIFEQILM